MYGRFPLFFGDELDFFCNVAQAEHVEECGMDGSVTYQLILCTCSYWTTPSRPLTL